MKICIKQLNVVMLFSPLKQIRFNSFGMLASYEAFVTGIGHVNATNSLNNGFLCL